MRISRRSRTQQGRTTGLPQATIRAPLLLFTVVVAASCARVPSPQETAMPGGVPAPPPAEQPAVAPVDTTAPPEPPRAEPMPEPEPVPEPDPAEVPVPPMEARALTDVHWRLTDLGNAPVVAGALAERAPYLQLSLDGTRVTGATGCNTFSGPYTLAGEALTFGALVMTKVACTDPSQADQEQRFLSALEMADRFEINGDVLILYAGMEPVARFEAAVEP